MGRKGRGERGGFHITFLIHKRVRNWFTGHISMTLGFGGTRLDGAFGRTRREGKGTERPKSVTLVFRARWFLGHTGVRGARWLLGHTGVRGKGGCRAKNKEKGEWGKIFAFCDSSVSKFSLSLSPEMMTHKEAE